MKKNYVKPAMEEVGTQLDSLLTASQTVKEVNTNVGITGGTEGSSEAGRSRTGSIWDEEGEEY